MNPVREDYDKIRAFYNQHGGDLLRTGDLPELDQNSMNRVFDHGAIKAIDPEGSVRYYAGMTTIVLITTDEDDWDIIASGMIACRQTLRRYVGTIEYVLVRSDWRGRGMGKYLMGVLLKDAESIKVDRLELTSEPAREAARALYKRMGFKLVEGSDRHFVLDL